MTESMFCCSFAFMDLSSIPKMTTVVIVVAQLATARTSANTWSLLIISSASLRRLEPVSPASSPRHSGIAQHWPNDQWVGPGVSVSTRPAWRLIIGHEATSEIERPRK